jgi:hypothetical protein
VDGRVVSSDVVRAHNVTRHNILSVKCTDVSRPNAEDGTPGDIIGGNRESSNEMLQIQNTTESQRKQRGSIVLK